MIPVNPDPLLTVPEVVDYLNQTVSDRLVRRLIQEREIASVKVGRCVRVRVSAVEDYLSRAGRK